MNQYRVDLRMIENRLLDVKTELNDHARYMAQERRQALRADGLISEALLAIDAAVECVTGLTEYEPEEEED